MHPQTIICSLIGILTLTVQVVAQDDVRIGTIPVRQELDGAGPSNIFHLIDERVALVDPLLSQISILDLIQKGLVGSCKFELDFRPWRLVRSQSTVIVVNESETRSIVVPRDAQLGNCQLQTRSYQAQTDAAPRLVRPKGDRFRIDVPKRPGSQQPGLVIKSPGRTLYSAQELEPQGQFRHVIVKRLAVDDAKADGRLKVETKIARFAAATGKLVDQMTIDQGGFNQGSPPKFTGWKKRAFDYATILTNGDVLVVYYRSHNAAAEDTACKLKPNQAEPDDCFVLARFKFKGDKAGATSLQQQEGDVPAELADLGADPIVPGAPKPVAPPAAPPIPLAERQQG